MTRRNQQGAALMSVLFLIVVIGVLGAFAIQSGNSQKQGVNLSLLEARANAAALMGVEYAANRILAGSGCPAGLLTIPGQPPGMDNLTVNIVCPGATGDIIVTASFGVLGEPDFVQREQIRRVSPFATGMWSSPTQAR